MEARSLEVPGRREWWLAVLGIPGGGIGGSEHRGGREALVQGGWESGWEPSWRRDWGLGLLGRGIAGWESCEARSPRRHGRTDWRLGVLGYRGGRIGG